jgi:hypothetical protein
MVVLHIALRIARTVPSLKASSCGRGVPARRHLRGQDSQGHQAGRPSRRAADEVRAGDQPQDREGAWADHPTVGAGAGGPGDRVSRERQVRLAGGSPAGARARRLVAWIAEWRETETLKPIDKAIERMVSESPGRNASEREVAPKDPNPGGRAVDYPAKATRAVAVWLTRRRAPAGLGATAR